MGRARLEFDIAAAGDPIEASKRFNDKFGAELIMSLEIRRQDPVVWSFERPKEFGNVCSCKGASRYCEQAIRLVMVRLGMFGRK